LLRILCYGWWPLWLNHKIPSKKHSPKLPWSKFELIILG
jgi:hypothetical protein